MQGSKRDFNKCFIKDVSATELSDIYRVLRETVVGQLGLSEDVFHSVIDKSG